jgi:hypothetical protein
MAVKNVIFIFGLSLLLSLSGCSSGEDLDEIRSLQLKVDMLQEILTDKEALLRAKEEEQGITGIVWDTEEVDRLQDQIQYLRRGMDVRKEMISKLEERLKLENKISK